MGCQNLKPTIETSGFAVSMRDCLKKELLLLKNYGKAETLILHVSYYCVYNLLCFR